MTDPERRRRRLRHVSPGGEPDQAGTEGDEGSVVTSEVHDPAPTPRAGRRASGGPGSGHDDRDGERGLRGLVGPGASQVGVSAAMRARDASQPTAEQLAEAEERLVVVRRNWTPREELPRNGR